jgi:hypothetical protein
VAARGQQIEELKLVVDLQDNASAGLDRLNAQLRELGGGGHLQRIRQQSGVLSDVMKVFAGYLLGASKNMEALGQRYDQFADISKKTGAAAYSGTRDVAELGTGIRDLARTAELYGTTYAQIKTISEQMAAMGITAEQSVAITTRAIETQSEARRKYIKEGSLFTELIEKTARADLVLQLRADLAKAASPKEVENTWIKFFQTVEQETRKYYRATSEADMERQVAFNKRRVAEIVGFDEAILHAKLLKEEDKDRSDFLNQTAKSAKEIADHWDSIGVNVQKMKDLMSSPLYSASSPYVKGLALADKYTASIYSTLFNFKRDWSGTNFWTMFFDMPAELKTIIEFFRNPFGGGGNSGVGSQRAAPPSGGGGGPYGGAPMTQSGGANDLATQLGINSLPNRRGSTSPGTPGRMGTPQFFSGSGDTYGDPFGKGQKWRYSTNIEDRRGQGSSAASGMSGAQRKQNTQLLRDANEKLIALLSPGGGVGGTGGAGIGGITGGPGGGIIGRALGGASDGGGGARTPGVSGRRSSGGAPAQDVNAPQPPAMKSGGRYPNIENVKQAAKDQLLKEGANEEQAEKGANALVGQAIAESGLRSQYHDAGKGPGGAARGYVPSIYGADHARGQAMMRWMTANHLDPNNTANQARWMAYEVMHGGYGKSKAAILDPHPNQGRIADNLTVEYEAPQTRYSAATQAERRRNAQLAAGVKPPDPNQQQPPAAAPPPTAQQPNAQPQQPATAQPGKASGNQDPNQQGILLGFKGKNGAFDADAFNKYAASKKLRPVIIDEWETNKAVDQANALVKDHKGPVHVFGFSLGAQSAVSYVKQHPDTASATTVGAFHDTDLSRLATLPQFNNYPDFSTYSAPAGEGVRIPHAGTDPGGVSHVGGMAYVADRAAKGANLPPDSQGNAVAPTGTGDKHPLVTESQIGAEHRRWGIQSGLKRQLEYAGAINGLRVEVTSGGQPVSGTETRDGITAKHKGSHRHDYGGAADLVLYDAKDGHKLDMNNSADAVRMAAFTRSAVAAGASGVGAGQGYMGANTIHVGGGTPAYWGGEDGSPPAPWIASAWQEGRKNPVSAAEIDRVRNDAIKQANAKDTDTHGPTFANIDFHKVRTTIDTDSSPLTREMSRLGTVEGRLTADVVAPPGTRVTVLGTGAFKSTETSRRFMHAAAITHPDQDRAKQIMKTASITHPRSAPENQGHAL